MTAPGLALREYDMVLRAGDVLEVDEALKQLAEVEPDLARIVELRYFGGLTSDQIAEVVGVSVPTVTRRWRMARAWLYRYLTGDALDGS